MMECNGVNQLEKMKTELAVISAGPVGLAAAIAAAEQGVKVCVFEKAATVGGTANMGMGPFGVESNLQKRSFIGLTKEEAFRRFMDYEHWTVDANLVHNYIWKSGDTINWLEDMGVKFAAAAKYFPDSEATWHLVQPESGMPGPRSAGTMTRIMADRARELGVEFYMETPAVRIRKEDGRITGLVVQRGGEELEVEAQAVLVATGGFGDNPEMIQSECGYILTPCRTMRGRWATAPLTPPARRARTFRCCKRRRRSFKRREPSPLES